MKKYSKEEIEQLNYTDFISLIKEENRPSGGKATIREIAINSFANSNSKVLEIGCTNGFSSIELNKIINCNVIGIDINKNSIKNANLKIDENKLDHNKISFEYGNAEDLRFNDNEFDLIICGNAISFINNKEKAFNEIIRVLKPNGFISLVPIWYYMEPRHEIIEKVNKILGFNITCYKEKDWCDFSKQKLELYYKSNHKFKNITDDDINFYVNNMIDSKECLKIYGNDEIDTIKKRWFEIVKTFSQNLSMTNYSVILLRKGMQEEPEIFLTERSDNNDSF